MKPALHRSLIFWAGLLVITFTCWAWWDSCSYISGFQWNKFSAASAPHRITICQYVGGNFVLIGTRKPVPRSRVAPQPGPFPPPFLVRSHSGRTKTSHPVKESV